MRAVLLPDSFAVAYPQPEDILLVIEVADTSVEYDRKEKIPRYAQVCVPEVWLVDVSHGTVTQYTQPDGMHYRAEQTLTHGQVVFSHALPTLHVSVEQIIG